MPLIRWVVISMVAVLASAEHGWSFAQEAPAATTPATAPSAADEAFAPLGRDLNNLYQSLSNKGGMAEEDKPFVSALRDRVAEFSRQFPDDPRGPAAELLLATWLKDDELVEALYQRVLRTSPDNTKVRLGWANRLKSQNKYGEALDVSSGHDFDPAKEPEAFVARSECLFAEQRYQEALDALNAIPAEVLEKNLLVKTQVEQAKPLREEYVALWTEEQSIRLQEEAADTLPRALILTAKGPITVELFEDHAPNTVANFISLVDKGFYNGTKFHRVIANFMAQGGDPNTREGATGVAGQGNPGYFIPDEAPRRDHRKHFTGTLAMAKQDPPNTGGSQFYITHTATPHLNGKHTVFGRVIEGLDIARSLEQDDAVQTITMLRKREHEYVPNTLPLEGQAATQPQPGIIEPTPVTTQPDLLPPSEGAAETKPDAEPAPAPATTAPGAPSSP